MPWQWSIEERLQARFDRDQIRERIDAYRAEQSAIGRTAAASGEQQPDYIVLGSRNPELFLPYELMNSVLRGVSGDVSLRSRARATHRDAIVAFGWDPEALWSRLEQIASSFDSTVAQLEAVDREMKMAAPPQRRKLETEMDRLRIEHCAVRVRVLQDARQIWSDGEFDRFLYTVIAPGLNVFAYDVPASSAQELRATEGGCK